MRSRQPRPVRQLVVCLTVLVAACGPTATPTAPPAQVTAGAPTATGSAPTGVVPRLELKVVVDGLISPVDVADPGDGSGRRFVVEQAGRIRIVRGGSVADGPFLDIGAEVKSGG